MWREETVIHGDIKADNILVASTHEGQSVASASIWLVDWEFVHRGDPAWDLASALHDFVMLWIGSMPLKPELAVEEMIGRAKYPLSALRPAIRALWEGYSQTASCHAGAGGSSALELLERAVAFSAARLIQAAHELSLEREVLPTQAVLLLQLGANLLADTCRGRLGFYGLSTGSSA